MRTLPFALLFSLFMASCSSSVKSPTLSGTSWEVATIVDVDSIIDLTMGDRPSVMFTSQTEFNAHTPCNSIAGVYKVGEKGKIEMNTQSSTMALCPDVVYESSLIRALENVKFFVVVDDTLKLKDIDGRIIVKLSN